MPLIRRKIYPSSLSRRPSGGSEEVNLDYDLNAVSNVTLCNAVRQLASIILAAESVYSQLYKELDNVALNAQNLCGRLTALENTVGAHDPKAVTVPEGDLREFSLRKEHFCSEKNVTTFLFTSANQPDDVAKLYNDCCSAPHMDNAEEDRNVVCEPVLADSPKREKLRKLNLDIETRRPASFVTLRDWCSDDETLVSEFDLLPVSPATPLHHPPTPHPSGQKLPLPEQRQEALSHKYPPKLVPIDVSGSGFKRMQVFRQSLVQFDYAKTKKRKRLKRRNTIANAREVQSSTLPSTSSGIERSSSSRFGFSLTDRSFDTSSTKTSCERELPHHLLGFDVSVPTPPSNVNYTKQFWRGEARDVIIEAEIHHSSPRLQKKVVQTARKLDMAGCHEEAECHNDVGCQSVTNFETPVRPTLKLREGSSREEGTRSSSGNWSGSSSAATSIESDHQQPDTSPKNLPNQSLLDSSPEQSISQDSFISDSLGALSASALLLSNGTLTSCEDIPFADDDTSSAFSCDAEGYYTSFHTDSGLFHSDAVSKTENYDLKQVGESDCDTCRTSTGTTNSSSASLKTVVMRNPERKVPPKPPQRVSSLEKEKRESIITVIHLNGSTSSREDLPGSSRSISSHNSGDSSRSASSQESEQSKTDSGRDTLSSARDSISRTEAEGQKDDFRSKTAINAIPSMCAITPPLSDDEKGSRKLVLQVEKPLAAVETKLYQKSQQQTPIMRSAGVRQPGDGAVAPPSAVVTRTNDRSKPNLILMSQKRASTGDLTPILKDRLPEVTSEPKTYVEPYTLDKSVGERRAEIQSIFKDKILAGGDPQKIPRFQHNDNQVEICSQSLPTTTTTNKEISGDTYSSQSKITKGDIKRAVGQNQRQGNVIDLRSQAHHNETSNLVAYKQLPAMSSNPPVCGVSSVIKKPHPTNSLDRRSTSKMTAHVALDSEGKVVYSSDSLPRRKGHASFEPGPYVKPPPISSDKIVPLKSKSPGYSSIQNMPLPPVPSEIAVAPPKNTQVQFIQHKPQTEITSNTQSYQPKSGTPQITTVSHTLSGLSSQLQPRTVSEINALRNSKSKPNKYDIDDNTSKVSYFSDSEESSVQQRIQQQLKIRMEARNNASSPSLPISTNQNKKNEGKCHTLPNPKHAQQTLQSLSYQQQLIQQAHQQQQQLQQLQEEQHRRNQQTAVTLQPSINSGQVDSSSSTSVLSKIPEAAYPNRQNAQHVIYQSHNEILRQQSSVTDPSRKPETLLPQPSSMGPIGPSPVYQTQIDPSLALAQQQMQAAQAASLGEHAVLHTRQHNTTYQQAGRTSRVATPIQGTSSPNRLSNSSNTLQYPLRSQTDPIYASQRSVQGGGHQKNHRATPIPQAMTQSPSTYNQYNVTNSDIYGRIGMTRQVFVGGMMPSGLNRNHRAYSSLPPNLRHPVLSAETLQRVNQNVERALTRRASVLGTETAPPETPVSEKVVDKKNNKKDKKKKDNKTDKPKKKWFWTLPLHRKKKEKEGEDDDGGFKNVSDKTTRQVPPQEDTSFIRYPSPDTGSTDMNSSYSSESSDNYRTTSEAYYYQKSQLAQLQQHRNIIDNTMNSCHGQLTTAVPPITSIPRSHSATVVSSQEVQASNVLPISNEGDMTDLTSSRRYMSRDELYAAMRHPQYYNNSRNSISSEYSANSTSSSSRSNSPAVFGMTPPAYVIKPQVRDNYGGGILSPRNVDDKSTAPVCDLESYDYKNSFQSKDIMPPTGYGDASSVDVSMHQNIAGQSAKQISKQTSITDFKKMILEKSMISAGGKERVSAVEMLRASRPNIYGYSPPPSAEISRSIEHPPSITKRYGVIMPPTSRNTARALLFQSRFGSGGRYRTPKTDIISTTIVEDKMQEDIEEEEEDSDEELTSGSSPERSSVISVKSSRKVSLCSSENIKKEMDHSTPMKDTESSLPIPNVSIILPPNSAANSRTDAETSL